MKIGLLGRKLGMTQIYTAAGELVPSELVADCFALAREVRELDPELPVSSVRTMDEWISGSAATPRLPRGSTAATRYR